MSRDEGRSGERKISGTFENDTVAASEGKNMETSGSIRRNAKVSRVCNPHLL